MGVNIHVLRLALHAKKQGANFEKVITIGRLDALLTPDQVEQEFASFDEPLLPGEAANLLAARDRFCEPILERMGARSVDSLDASDYEGATIVHNLNNPIPEDLKQRFSLVIDGGTLEHVFHFPEALKTCMSLAQVGGHVLLALPTNNEMGHGFYQFSPDLFFRAFSEENGYRLKGVYLVPIYSHGEWHKVEDPAIVGQRVGHNLSVDPTHLLVLAERIKDVPLFAKPPQQSDYVVAWNSGNSNRMAFFDECVDAMPVYERRKRLRSFIPGPILKLRRIFNAGRHVTKGPDPSQFLPFDPRLKRPRHT